METFVVRIWRPADDEMETARCLRGTVDCVRTGTSDSFRRDEELLGLLRVQLAAIDPSGARSPCSTEKARYDSGGEER
jgi:hypothetical protein